MSIYFRPGGEDILLEEWFALHSLISAQVIALRPILFCWEKKYYYIIII